MGNFGIYIYIYILFCWIFWKIFSSIVENSKNLERKNLESNPNLVPKNKQISYEHTNYKDNKRTLKLS